MSYFLVVIASLFITLKAGTLTSIATCPLQATDCVGTASNPICCTQNIPPETFQYENGCYAQCNNPNTPAVDLTDMCGVCCVGDGAVCADGVGVCSAPLDVNGYCVCGGQCELHSLCGTDAGADGECVPPVSAFACNSCQTCTSIYSSYLTCTIGRDCDNLGVGFECLPASLLPSSPCSNFLVCKKCSEMPNGCNPSTVADDGCLNAEQICDATGGGVCGTCVSAPTTTKIATTDPCATQCSVGYACDLTGGAIGECASVAGKCNDCQACSGCYDAGDCGADEICESNANGVCGTCQIDLTFTTTSVPITTDPCAAECVADRECALPGGTLLDGECTAATYAGKCNQCEACHVKYTEVGVSVGCLPDAGDCAANEICELNNIGVCGTCQIDPTLTTTTTTTAPYTTTPYTTAPYTTDPYTTDPYTTDPYTTTPYTTAPYTTTPYTTAPYTTAPCPDACVYDASTDNVCYDDATAAYGECTPVANSCNVCKLCSRKHTGGCSLVETAECGATQTCVTANQLTACGTCCSADCDADPIAVCRTADGADGACSYTQPPAVCDWICEPIIATTTDAAVDPCVNVCVDPCYYDNHGVDTPGQCADDVTLQCPVCTACGEIYASPDFEVCTDANPDVCGADRECVSAGIDANGDSLYCKICVDITATTTTPCVDECAANAFCVDASGLITGKCMHTNSGCLACVPCAEFGKCSEADVGSACLVGAGSHGICVRDAGKCGVCEAHPTTTDAVVTSTAASCDTCSLGSYCASGECVEDTTTNCKTCVACDAIPGACVDFECVAGEVCDRTAATNVRECGRCTVVADQSTTDTAADGTETSTSGWCECETAEDCADALPASHYYCTDCVCCKAGCGDSVVGEQCSLSNGATGECDWDSDGVCFECVADTTTTRSVLVGSAKQMGIMVGMVFVSAIVFV